MILNKLSGLMAAAKMNFSNLSGEGLMAFILGLVFSVLSIAAFIYFAKNKNIGKPLAIVTTIVLPFLSIFCWIYLIMNIYSQPLPMALAISFASALAYTVVAIVIAAICNNVSKSNNSMKTIREQDAKKVEKTQVTAPVAKKEEKKSEEKILKPLLIAQAVSKTTTEETPVAVAEEKTAEEKVEKIEEKTVEPVEEVEENIQEPVEEVVEETIEPVEEEVVPATEEETESEAEESVEESEEEKAFAHILNILENEEIELLAPAEEDENESTEESEEE